MKKKLEIAVIGAGAISESHIGALAGMEDARVAAVADIVTDKAEKLAARYSIKAYSDYKEMLDREKPDIAVITLPHFLHRQAAFDCAARGCNILLEKPMAMDAEECDDIINLCGNRGVKLMIGHVRHFYNCYNRIREIIISNLLGELIMITNVRYCNYFAPSRPGWFLHNKTAGGGIVMNLGSHSFDIVQYLSGSRVKTVGAKVGRFAEGIEVEGNAQIFAVLESGVTASITLSGYVSVPRSETELIFTKGMIKTTDDNGGTLFIGKDGIYEEVEVVKEDPLKLQMESFVKSIIENLPSPVTGEYGRSVVRAIRAAYESSENNGAVQELLRPN